ncbi:MAG: FAD-binding oxidoreductase [Acidobacteria bacterium]|nr:FAD-binding oxidoreductase [Acidobacteriota bacterium]
MIRGLEGRDVDLDDKLVQDLRAALEGALLASGDKGYDEARTIWNGMVDRRPALVARCVSSHDVVKAVGFAGHSGALVSIRGAGHHIAGNSVVEGGLMIDLSTMRAVDLNAKTGVVTVGPGATLADLDAVTGPSGWAVPTGINSTTGVAGLTLGAGFGWLSRKHGMTIDSLLSAEVVTASGEVLTASATENPDLFWAVRGGGGNFGVVTSFRFQAHRVGPNVLSGLIVHPMSAAREALAFYRDFSGGAPDELTVWAVLRKAPPLPFLPAEVHGKPVVIFALAYCGDPAEGERALAPLQAFGAPVGTHIGVQPFAAWQQAFDPLLTPGARNYWKSHNFTELADGLLEQLIATTNSLPSDASEVFIAQLGGAQGRIASDATAYPHRDTRYVMNIHTRWDAAADDDRCIAWARKQFAATAPFATGGSYSNFMPDDGDDPVAAAYGANAGRLAEIKAKFDPRNLFRMNHNVRPRG